MKKLFQLLCIFAACMLLSGVCLAADGYLIRDHNGFVAVWDCEKEQWSETTGVPVSSLPETDRNLIRGGIPAASMAEATSMLEDYCG